jgi:hypothetical protein
MPLLALIPLVWLAIVTLLLALCRTAARGDEALAAAADRGSPWLQLGGLVLFEDTPVTVASFLRPAHRRRVRVDPHARAGRTKTRDHSLTRP